MTLTLLSLLFKRFFRSSSFGKDLTLQIILGFITIVVGGYFLILGFSLEKLIVNILKQDNAVAFLNGILIYYFIGEFIIRYAIQSLPTLDIRPFLHLPVKKSRIVNLLLGISLIQVLNIIVFLLFGPFAFGAVTREFGIQHAWIWMMSLWFISLILHFLTVLVKLNSNQGEWKLFAMVAVFGLIAGTDNLGLIKLSSLGESIFSSALQGYATTPILFLTLILLYYVAYRTILNKLYPEELKVRENESHYSTNSYLSQRFGLTGTWISLELKMIFRNKRTREVFFMSSMFVVQQLILCYITKKQDYGAFLCLGIVSTGLFIGNYGQYIFSWQGDHFDFTLTQPTSLRAHVEAKYWLLALVTGFWFITTIPFVYFGWNILLINLAGTLYNIGVNLFVVMNMAMWYTTRLSLRNGGALNYEGAGAAQWLIGIPFLLGPYLFYLPFSLMGHKELGILAIGLLGLTGILLRRRAIDFICKRLFDKRYDIASSFRKE